MRIACAPNFRDMGGVEVHAGGRIRPGRLFRAEAICAPVAEDAASLATLGIRLVCDLRSQRERDSAASHWPATGAAVLAMDVVADFRAADDPFAAMRADPGENGARQLMRATYEALPDACAPHLAILFERLAMGDHPVLIHCTAGKDRTGFFSAMILHVLGAPWPHILADYLMSGERGHDGVVAATRAIMEKGLGHAVDERALAALTGVRADYLAAALDSIARTHGSLDRYLRDAAGLDAARHARLIAQLVE